MGVGDSLLLIYMANPGGRTPTPKKVTTTMNENRTQPRFLTHAGISDRVRKDLPVSCPSSDPFGFMTFQEFMSLDFGPSTLDEKDEQHESNGD